MAYSTDGRHAYDDNSPTLTLPQVAAGMHMSLRSIQEMIAAGEINVIRMRRRVLVSRAEFERLIGVKPIEGGAA